MRLDRVGVLALGTLTLWAGSAVAAETFARGQTVVREIADSHGHRFAITVTPPGDRGADPRIFEFFAIAKSDESASGPGYRARGGSSKKVVATVEEEALDVSGYKVRIESLSAASCDLVLGSEKKKPVTLKGGFTFEVTAAQAAAMTVTLWPTSNDVDAEVDIDDEVCDISERNKGELDAASCFINTCSTASTMYGYFYNPFSSTAKFVGSIFVVFAN